MRIENGKQCNLHYNLRLNNLKMKNETVIEWKVLVRFLCTLFSWGFDSTPSRVSTTTVHTHATSTQTWLFWRDHLVGKLVN